MPKPLVLSERDVTRQVKDFLEHRGWRPLRTQSGQFRNPSGEPFQIGEPGMADYLFVNYLDRLPGKPTGVSIALWIELKKPGARTTCHCEPHNNKTCRMHRQMKWKAREEARGAAVVQVDDIDVFLRWYEERFGWLHRSTGQLDLFLGQLAGVEG